MSIEGLGKKFQQAREAKGLTLDEAARMTKIRPSRLAEIEADDFSQFPSLAYAKGFLLIYGKFLDVDVSQYLEVFETSSQVTVDGYSYLQDAPAPKPRRERAPVIRHRPVKSDRASPWPLLVGAGVIIAGFLIVRLFVNLERIAPRTEQRIGVPEARVTSVPSATVTPSAPIVQATPTPAAIAVATIAPTATAIPTVAAVTPTTAPQVAIATATATPTAASLASTKQPEIRRAEPVRPEDLAKAGVAETPNAVESTGPNRVAIKPLRKTYIKVTVDNDAANPPFERWISPSDGVVEFRGQHIAVRVLDRDAIQIRKNGKPIASDDDDVTVE